MSATAMQTPDGLAIDESRWLSRIGLESSGRATLMLQAAIGVAAFLLVEPVMYACGRLPSEVYEGPVIVLRAVQQLPVMVMLAAAVITLILGRRLTWTGLHLGREIRWVAFASAMALGWAFSTYTFNYWFDQPHDLDRVLMLVLPWLVLWRPAWLGVFLLQAFVVTGQFNEPLQFSWTDKLLVYEVLLLLYVFVLMNAVNRRVGFLPFLMAAICLVSIYYALPGAGKAWLAWVPRNEMNTIALTAWHQNGWLGWLDADTHARLQGFLAATNGLMQIFVLALELAVVAMLLHRRLAIALLAGCIAMHIGIFATTGICFWKWVILDVSLIIVLWRLDPQDVKRMFGLPAFLLQLVVLAALFLWHPRPVVLAWYDAPMSFQFRIELVGESGTVYHVPPGELAPYDLPFAQGRFYYATRTPMLVNCLGSTMNWQLVKDLQAARDADDVYSLRVQHGRSTYDQQRAADFDLLLERFVKWRRETRRSRLERLPRPPKHIWTSAAVGEGLPVYEGQERVLMARIRLREALIRDHRLHETHNAVVRQLDWSMLAEGGEGRWP